MVIYFKKAECEAGYETKRETFSSQCSLCFRQHLKQEGFYTACVYTS